MLGESNNFFSYVLTAIIIILIILIIIQFFTKQIIKKSDGPTILVKTSNGVIELRQKIAADEMAKLYASFWALRGYKTNSKFAPQIIQVLLNLERIITVNGEIKVDDLDDANTIFQKAMLNALTPDSLDRRISFGTVLDMDEFDHAMDEDKFAYMLAHIDVLIQYLRKEVCNNGILDLVQLEQLLWKMDKELTNGPVTQYSSSEIGCSYSEAEVPRLSLFATEQTPIEGFNVESDVRTCPQMYNPQNLRNKQLRAELFEENKMVMGSKHYLDEDLLLVPNYQEVAL